MSDSGGAATRAGEAPPAPPADAAPSPAPAPPATPAPVERSRTAPATSRTVTTTPTPPRPPAPPRPPPAPAYAPPQSTQPPRQQEAPPRSDGNWLKRLFYGASGPEEGAERATSAPERAPADAPQRVGPGTPAETEPAPPAAAPSAPALSDQAQAALAALEALSADELEALAQGDNALGRKAQSIVDRREARRQREQADQGRLTRSQQLAALEEQERQARQTDVYQAAQLRDQLDAHRAQEQFVTGMVRAYDGATLDPLVLALPEGERTSLLADVPPGLDGRRQLVESTLKRLEQRWRADEASKLKQSAAFRKQVLAEWRSGALGDADAPDEDPELLPGGTAHRRGPSMNDWLRGEIRRGGGAALG